MKRKAAGASAVSVRMYNVGLGDSFLITFPAPDRPRKVLIDCGSHNAGPGPYRARDVAKSIVTDVTEHGVPRIDVVVCSHRHEDHVSGFEDSSIWAGVHVGEIWLPWTEDRSDPAATRIRHAQAKKAKRLTAALAPLARAGGDARLMKAHAVAENSLTNAPAMETLHSGFVRTGTPRFLPEGTAGNERRVLETPALPGVKVHVLGPARDAKTIRDMNPPPDEAFLQAAADGAGAEAVAPFLRDWSLSAMRLGPDFKEWFAEMAAAAQQTKDDTQLPLQTSDPQFVAKWLRRIELSWRRLRKVDDVINEDDALAAAVALDKAVNGTSIVLVFEIGRAVLLFPGDAQWGTWQRALADPEWRELLERTTFYKVGHHGSENATPVTFVKQVLRPRFLGMVSTRETKVFDEIPRAPLLDKLRAKPTAGLIRSDARVIRTPFRHDQDRFIDVDVPLSGAPPT